MRIAVEVGTRVREFAVFVPLLEPDLDGPVPVVFVLHRNGANIEDMINFGFNELAARDGWIIVYLQASEQMVIQEHFVEGESGWVEVLGGVWPIPHSQPLNAGWGTIDDEVDYFLEVYGILAGRFAMEPACVFLAGHGEGGTMAYTLAARMPWRITGVMTYGATMGSAFPQGDPAAGQADDVPTFASADPVAVLAVHGMLDGWTPINNPQGLPGPSVERAFTEVDPTLDPADLPVDLSLRRSVQLWLDHNNCGPLGPTALPAPIADLALAESNLAHGPTIFGDVGEIRVPRTHTWPGFSAALAWSWFQERCVVGAGVPEGAPRPPLWTPPPQVDVSL